MALVVAVAALGVAGWAWLGQARERTRRTVCTERLRQLSDAFQDYLAANGRLPLAARLNRPQPMDWVFWQADRDIRQSAVAPFLKPFEAERLRCPGDVGALLRPFRFSYTMYASLEFSQLAAQGPSGRILLAEEERPNDGCWAAGQKEDRLTRRHGGQANVAFADGHVQFIQTEFEEETP